MKIFAVLLSLGFAGGAIAAEQCPGSWYLEPDDCICMNSREGYLLKDQTLGCCRRMGYKTYNNVSPPSVVGPAYQHLLTDYIIHSDLRRGPRQATGVQGLLQKPEPGKRYWPLSLNF
jgi:hypothetical protein